MCQGPMQEFFYVREGGGANSALFYSTAAANDEINSFQKNSEHKCV